MNVIVSRRLCLLHRSFSDHTSVSLYRPFLVSSWVCVLACVQFVSWWVGWLVGVLLLSGWKAESSPPSRQLKRDAIQGMTGQSWKKCHTAGETGISRLARSRQEESLGFIFVKRSYWISGKKECHYMVPAGWFDCTSFRFLPVYCANSSAHPCLGIRLS